MTETIEINGYDELIDSRDVIGRLSFLHDKFADLVAAAKASNLQESPALHALADWLGCVASEITDWCEAATSDTEILLMHDSDESDELIALQELNAEFSGWSGWANGVILIHVDHFEKYAMELASDTGAVPDANVWPCTYINWDKAVNALKDDYHQLDFRGNTFYLRQ